MQMSYFVEIFTSSSTDLENWPRIGVQSAGVVHDTAGATDVECDTQNPIRIPQVGHWGVLSRRMQSKEDATEEGTLVIAKQPEESPKETEK